MKAVNILIFTFVFALISFEGVAQTSNDFFVGKWEISIIGSPRGDVKMVTNLTREEGKLVGELKKIEDDEEVKLTVNKIIESEDKIKIFFEAEQVGEIAIDLTKVDEDNMKGVTYEYFETVAKRVK